MALRARSPGARTSHTDRGTPGCTPSSRPSTTAGIARPSTHQVPELAVRILARQASTACPHWYRMP
eukprot:15166643-Alexandrium_andersonii.AAC.1